MQPEIQIRAPDSMNFDKSNESNPTAGRDHIAAIRSTPAVDTMGIDWDNSAESQLALQRLLRSELVTATLGNQKFSV
jgi:hypothetical protein